MKIVLASQSPRRIELLKSLNLQFETVPSDTDEFFEKDDQPLITVMSLAFEKAYDIAKKYPDAVVLAFDTIVYQNGILGKPLDVTDALNMLNQLNGKVHEVYTGIAIIHLQRNIKVTDVVKTDVYFKNVSEAMLKRYVATGEPLDKAGAYGIQGYGALLIDKINGDFFAVMGLPLSKLDEHLRSLFEINLL